MQQFGYYEPSLIINLLSVYSTALYSSSLWQLSSDEHFKLTRSWNTAVKIIWDLPHSTHTRFLEYLSPVPHLESVLTGRYIGFVGSLLRSPKPLLSLLFSSCKLDISSQTGQNIAFLLQKHNKISLMNLIKDKNTLKKAKLSTISDDEIWKMKIIEDIALTNSP